MAFSTKGLVALFASTVISRLAAELTFTVNPVNLNESTPAGTVLSKASDPVVNNSRDAYRIVGGDSDKFSIDPDSGIIKNKEVFNFETDVKQYELTVESSLFDHKDRQPLIINIIDIPEKPQCTDPKFLMERANITIDENYPALTSIYRVEATDEDLVNGDKLNYTMKQQLSTPQGGGDFFSVDPDSGIVSRNSKQPLDYDEGYHTFHLVMKATDMTGNFCQGKLVVHIRDLNDESPKFESLPSDSWNVTEKENVGNTITTVKAVDRDMNSNITYMFAKPQSVFGLDPKTGTITLLERLDSDSIKDIRVHQLQLEARDDGNVHTASYTLTIFVQEVNDNPECDPSFSTDAGVSVSVPETFPAAAAVYTILAKDPDPGEAIEFSILRSSANTTTYFVLNPANGGIYRTADIALDYETDPKMVVAVKEKEKASPGSCTGTITINIQNVNDEVPVFLNTSDTHLNISENLPFETVVARLTAVDRDIGDTVHYEFVSSYRGFTINADTGDITITFPLDYEDPTVLLTRVLKVRAFDNDRQHSATTLLIITLQDVNDNLPLCPQDIYVKEIAETIPIGTPLVTLSCEDKDGTAPSNSLFYNLTLDNFSNATFTLEDNVIKVGPQHLDYDSVAFAALQFKHTLIVRVSDGGTPSHTSTVTVIVKVTRANEIAPHTGSKTFHVFENSKVGTVVGTVNFTDEDWPINNLKWTIIGDNVGDPPRFYIESNTGTIKVLNALDRETKYQYVLRVRATDLDNDIQPDPERQKSSTVTVTINVLNVNDEPPVCRPPHYDKRIYSTMKTPILHLNCSDKDSPAHQLSYNIVGGNGHNRFKLQRQGSGPPSLVTTQSFQYEVFRGIQDPTTFQLLIEVADEMGAYLPRRLSTTVTVIIHVMPWSTTKPSTTIKTTTTAVTTSVLFQTLYYWHPENWFAAVLTVTGALLLMSLYMAACLCFRTVPKCGMLFPKCCTDQSHPLLADTEQMATSPRKTNSLENLPTSDTKSLHVIPNSPAIYDGRALDRVTGKQYLFNSKTGDVPWLNQKTSTV